MPARKKRDDGEGSVYELPDGRWRAEVTIGFETLPGGKRKRVRRYVTCRSETAAKKARRDLLAKRQAGDLPIGDAVTVEAWMTYWLDEIAVHRCVPKTMESYRTLTKNWIIPLIGDVRLRALAPEHVERLHKAMRKGRDFTVTTKTGKTRVLPAKPLSAATRLQTHRILSRALKVAQQRGKVIRNVATLVDAPSQATAIDDVQYLDLPQARRFLDHVEGRWNAARWSVGLSLGPRQGEVLGLLWDEDVNLDAGTVTVQRQLQRVRGVGLTLRQATKNKKPRTIHLPGPLLAQLRAHRKAQLERRLAIGDEWVGSPLGDLVFTTPYGRAIEPRRDWQEWSDMLAELGIGHIRQHGGRHTAATLMLLQGVDVKVAADILGNDPSITQKIYQHVVAQMTEQATEAVASALFA